jgi:hypothetical protein
MVKMRGGSRKEVGAGERQELVIIFGGFSHIYVYNSLGNLSLVWQNADNGYQANLTVDQNDK